MAVTCVSPHLRAGLMRTSPSLRSIYTDYLRILSLWYLEKPEDTRLGANGVAYLNLTVSYSLLLTTTKNAFQRKEHHYE